MESFDSFGGLEIVPCGDFDQCGNIFSQLISPARLFRAAFELFSIFEGMYRTRPEAVLYKEMEITRYKE